MTLLNGFIQGDAAYLVADGCACVEDGRVADIGTKVICIPGRRMAVGWTGFHPRADFISALPGLAAQDPATALRAMAEMVRAQVADRKTTTFQHGLDLLIALWDDGPQLWTVQFSNRFLPAPYEPFTPMRLKSWMGLNPGEEMEVFGREVDFNDPNSFDPRSDMLALAEHCRRIPEDGRYWIGGFLHHCTVSASGIDEEYLRDWPDTIGFPIRPWRDTWPLAKVRQRVASWMPSCRRMLAERASEGVQVGCAVRRSGGLAAKLNSLSAEMKRELSKAVLVVAENVQRDAQVSITTGAVSGKGHVPSRPGEPPNEDTGHLRTGIIVEKGEDGLSARVTSTADYGAALELGTSKIAERPYMRPAAAKNRERGVRQMRAALDHVLKSGRGE